MLAQEIEGGIIVGLVLTVIAGVGWLIRRAIGHGDERTRADSKQDLDLALVRRDVDDFRARLTRIEASTQGVRDELGILGELFHRHETWHERHEQPSTRPGGA